ncbi:hypothetical protein DRP53_05405 [candidate division WOR-3 bacterium]|uniref:DUF4412 domain-containing protein n=1 Tax=candidate division WOR-3 bacterium TaxID=2052148 RepID=A0A660SHQ7_UNCW3|nr:MAG: hypothetical protein DRP53_05405 [candidate division WOR-3 bacterium]
MRIPSVLVLTFLSLSAGMVMKVRRISGNNEDTSVVYLDGQRIRIDDHLQGYNVSYIYRVRDRQVFFINHDVKSYIFFTFEILNELTGTMEMLLERLGPEVRVSKLGAERRGDYDCWVYEASKDGKRFARVWVVEPKTLGLDERSFENLSQLQRFIDRNTQQVSEMRREPFIAYGEIGGFPVEIVRYDKTGGVKLKETLLSAEVVKIDTVIFKEPEGYERVEAKIGER